MLKDKLFEIFERYSKLKFEEISVDTPVNRSTIVNSIAMHRLRSELKTNGFNVSVWESVKTLKDLLNDNSKNLNVSDDKFNLTSKNSSIVKDLTMSSIGIDIQSSEEFPVSSDPAIDQFYIDNFTRHEISYCVRQDDIYLSFAGFFAAKEAIYKAYGGSLKAPFNNIEIYHSDSGAPLCDLAKISISYTRSLKIAVAIASC